MKVRTHMLNPSVARGIAVVCAAVFVASAHTAHAGINVWTSHGPPGGGVYALAIDPITSNITPRTLYAGTPLEGVFKSTDAGATWSAANVGLPDAGVYALATDPGTPQTLYAGTLRGVFKSTDGGSTWNALNTGLNTPVVALAMDPVEPRRVYAGSYVGGAFAIEQVPPSCVGDCSGTATVAINDLITLVNIALGKAEPSACPNGLPVGGDVNVAVIIQAVNSALNGCGNSSNPLACDAITTAALGLPNLKVSAAQTVAATTDGASPSDNYPEHCRVQGTINERTGSDGKPYAIGFELRMPTDWNGKFFFQGGMGNEGRINPALGTLTGGSPTSNALSRGYAVTSTDAGHTSEAVPPVTGGALFGLDPQARVDYGYHAVSTLTPLAKQIVATHYAAPVQRSYFVGCSDGGRQALVAAARLGDQFDGIVAGAPGFNLPKTAIQHAWDTQQFLSVSPGNPAGAFTIKEMNLVGQRILAQCDALDGAIDGIVSDLAACQDAFELATDVPTCAGARDGSCLSAAQKTALQNVMNGPSNSSGEALYSTWPWDAGIAASAPGHSSWRAWKLGNPALGGLPFIVVDGVALPYIFTTPPVDLTRDPAAVVPALFGFLASYNFDTDAPKIFATSGAYTESAMSFMTPPNPTSLATFKARGKLLIYHGGADPEYSLNDTIRWYNELSANTPNFARLFVVPGMGHCDGGTATDQFDLLTALEDWVEEGIAPDAVVAGVAARTRDIPADWSAGRTRPLCAYPKRALLNPGATDLESASSFSCQ
jgi:pimeloyl-ACP methyl ester carboxylesterase